MDISDIKMAGDNILLKPMYPKKDKLLVMPDGYKPVTRFGKVVSAGKGKVNEQGVFVPNPVSVGDIVLFEPFRPGEYTLEGEAVMIMKGGDILAKVEEATFLEE